MLTAITHKPSRHIRKCELTFLRRRKIDVDKAIEQHEAYCEVLRKHSINVITLNRNLSLPDSVFVEDTALVLDKIAIMLPMGAKARMAESKLIETNLEKFRSIVRIKAPARIDGGDILRISKKLFVGNSTRTNKKGIRALHKIVSPLGFEVIKVQLADCLHLKTACTALDEKTVLLNPEWVDAEAFKNYKQIETPISQPFAANILRLGKTILVHSGFKRTQELLEEKNYQVESIDISEFTKAEAGLTCMSLIFDAKEEVKIEAEVEVEVEKKEEQEPPKKIVQPNLF